MTPTDVPVILVLLLPGFLATEVLGLVTYRTKRPSDFPSLLWSLIFSFVLLAPVATVWHQVDSDYPAFGQVVTNPKALPMRMALLLYAAAPLLGCAVGLIVRSRWIENKLAFAKWLVDLRGRHDVWSLAFRDAYYIIVHLKNGQVLHGYPEKREIDRKGGVSDIYLVHPRLWDEATMTWGEEPGEIEGIWLDATNIDRIDFTRRASPPKKPLKAEASNVEESVC